MRFLIIILLALSVTAGARTIEISREQLLDHIHRGWAGMLIGGLEGLPHENKYIDQPRESPPEFTFLSNPSVSQGGITS